MIRASLLALLLVGCAAPSYSGVIQIGQYAPGRYIANATFVNPEAFALFSQTFAAADSSRRSGSRRSSLKNNRSYFVSIPPGSSQMPPARRCDPIA